MSRTPRRWERIGSHSHIKGLGLDGLKALPTSDGMVGQVEAREAAGVIVRMIKEGKMAGRAILLSGPPGTGKTAIALAIAKELGEEVPFVTLSGSEIYSTEMKKTEVLMQAMRKAIGVRIHEMRGVYEGEVVAQDIRMTRHPYNPYQQIPESAKITLATKGEKKTFTVSQTIAANLINQGVSIGDIIMIDGETGRVTKLGRSEEAEEERRYDIEVAERRLPRPPDPVQKEKEFVYLMTVNDLDEIQARSGGFFSLLFGGGRAEIDNEIRQRVDTSIRSMVEEGKAEILPGVLFIDDIHMLDIEAFSFLSRSLESELAPIVILASNRGVTTIRGTDIRSPHGAPLDLLDRILIINTRLYTADEIREILKIRAKEEGVKISPEALEILTKIGEESSLRYAVQLLTPAAEIAKASNKEEVTVKEIEATKALFSDIKRSVEHLKRYEDRMLA